MTSHFDILMTLYDAAVNKGQKDYLPLVTLIFKHAVEELDLIEPERVSFKKWLEEREWRKTAPILEQQQHYIDYCHDALDHNNIHHLRCFSSNFVGAFSTAHSIIERDVYRCRKKEEIYLINSPQIKKDVEPYQDVWLEIVRLEGKKYQPIGNPGPVWKILRAAAWAVK